MEIDEQKFIDFLRSTGPIRLIKPAANACEFFIDNLLPRESGQTIFLIWNTDSPFELEARESDSRNEGTLAGRFSVGNHAGAPLSEYVRDASQIHPGNFMAELTGTRILHLSVGKQGTTFGWLVRARKTLTLS